MKRKGDKVTLFALIVAVCAGLGVYVQNREKQYKSFFLESNNAGAVMAPTIEKETDVSEEVIMVNINTDNIYELMQLDGIGEKTAKRIVDYRNENGDFEVIEDLMRIDGIGKQKFEKVKDNIYVE